MNADYLRLSRDPAAVTVRVEGRDRWIVADILMDAATAADAEARPRRKNSVPRSYLQERARRLRELAHQVRQGSGVQ